MTYEADDSGWPVCVDRMYGVATDEEVVRYNAQRAARLAREAVHVQIVDGRGAKRMNAAQRRAIADFNREQRPRQRRSLAGVAVVVDSALARGYLRAIYWLQPPPYPHAVFDDDAPALEWARARLREVAQ